MIRDLKEALKTAFKAETLLKDNGLDRMALMVEEDAEAVNEALKKAEEEMSSDENPNGNIYAKASQICQPQAISNGWAWNNANYINCMMTEIQKYPAADNIQDKIIASLPSTELYRKNYASPVFAFTLSGVMLLITFVVIVVIFIRVGWWIILRLSLLFV